LNFYSNDFILLFLGSGPDKVIVEELFKSSGISNNVIFLGDVPNFEIQSFYQTADIFINPTFAEGFPRVLLEAMACGLPIVTTDAGGIGDILGISQQHFMTPRDDSKLFSEKLNILLHSKSEQIKLSNENLVSVKRFYTKEVAKMYRDLLFVKKNI
jgi:glycosyltransferase involved in cell wall biosynthesis